MWAFSSARYAQGAREIGPVRVNLMRSVVGSILFGSISLLVAGGWPFRGLGTARLAWLFASALCAYAFADNLFFASTRRLGIATALSIATTYPLWAAVYGVVGRGEALGPPRIAGMLLSVGGVIALVRIGGASHAGRMDLGGAALALLTAILWACSAATVKVGAQDLPFWQIAAIRYTFAVGLLLPQLWLHGKPQPHASVPRVAHRLVPAFVCDVGIGSILYVVGLKYSDLAVAATLSAMSPLASLPIAIAMGEERWNLHRALAVGVTVTGVVILVIS